MAQIKDFENPNAMIPVAPPIRPRIMTGFLPNLSDATPQRVAVKVCEKKKTDAFLYVSPLIAGNSTCMHAYDTSPEPYMLLLDSFESMDHGVDEWKEHSGQERVRNHNGTYHSYIPCHSGAWSQHGWSWMRHGGWAGLSTAATFAAPERKGQSKFMNSIEADHCVFLSNFCEQTARFIQGSCFVILRRRHRSEHIVCSLQNQHTRTTECNIRNSVRMRDAGLLRLEERGIASDDMRRPRLTRYWRGDTGWEKIPMLFGLRS